MWLVVIRFTKDIFLLQEQCLYGKNDFHYLCTKLILDFYCHANAPPYREKMTFSTNFSDDQCQAKICDHFPRQTEHVKMGKKALIL